MTEKVDMAAAEVEAFNWVELWDETYEAYYYYNNVTTTSVWEKPQCWLDHEAAEGIEGADYAVEDSNRVDYPVPAYNTYNEYYGDYANEDYNQEYNEENAENEYAGTRTEGTLTDTLTGETEGGANNQNMTATVSEAYLAAYNEYHGDVSETDQSPQRSVGASVDLMSPMRSQRSNDPQLQYQPYNTPTRNPFSPGSERGNSVASGNTRGTKTPPHVPPLDFNNKNLVDRQKKERSAQSPPKNKEDEEKVALLQRIKELEESSATLKESSEVALQEQAAQMEKDKEEALQRQAIAVAALKKKEKEDALAQQAAELEAEKSQELSKVQKEKEEALVKMEKEVELKRRSAETFALLDSASPTSNTIVIDEAEALLSTEESTPGPGEGEVLQSGDVTDVLRSFRQERQREKNEVAEEAVHQNMIPLDATAVQQDLFLPIDTQPGVGVSETSKSIGFTVVDSNQNIDENEIKEDAAREENYDSSQGFYDFVRSPPRTNMSADNKNADKKEENQSQLDTKPANEKGSPSSESKLGKGYDLLTTGGKNNVIDDFASKLATLETKVASPDKEDCNDGNNDDNNSVTSDLSSQGSANWAVVQHQTLDSEFMDSMPEDEGDTVGSAGSNEMSEPVIDHIATENALRNQAMLYESSQQLQLGGAVASWAYGGGSTESLEGGQINMLALSSCSIEKVNSIEKGEEAGRSVTFADSNNVLEFKQDSLSVASGDNYEAPMAPPGTAGAIGGNGIAMDASNGYRFTEAGNTINLGNMVIPPYNRGSTLEEDYNNDSNGNTIDPYLTTINTNTAAPTMADVVLTESGKQHKKMSNNNDDLYYLNLPTGGTLDESKSELSAGIREERGVMLMSHNLSEEAAVVDTVKGKKQSKGLQIHTQPETDGGQQGDIGVRHNMRYGGQHSPDGGLEHDPASTSPDHPYAYRTEGAGRPPSSPPTSPSQRRSRSPSPTYSSSKEVGNERRGSTFGFTNRWLANGEAKHPGITKLPVKYPVKHNDDYVKHVRKKAFVTGIPSHVSAQKDPLEGSYGVDKNAKFHPEHLQKLCKPTEDRQLYKVARPRLGTECANLSFTEIDEMQSRSFSETAVGNIPTDVDKIRFVLRINNVKDDAAFERMLKKLPKTKKKYNESQILVTDTDNVDPQVLIDGLFGGKRKKSAPIVNPLTGKMVSPEKMSPEKSIVEKTEYMAENQSLSPFHSMHFLHRYYTRFMVVAFDFHLQFVGTFDVGTKTSTSGLNFEPGKLAIGVATLENPYQRWDAQKRTKPNPKQATVLELDLSKLPANVFAVVPIIFDDSVPDDGTSGRDKEKEKKSAPKRDEKGHHLKGDIPAVLKNVSFEMALYMHRKGVVDNVDAQTYQRMLQEIDGTLEGNAGDTEAHESKARRAMTRKEQEAMLRKEIRRSHDREENVEGEVGGAPFYSRTLMDSTAGHAGYTGVAEVQKVDGLWSSHDNMKFHYVRASNEKQHMRRKSCAIVRLDSKSKSVPLSLHEAFMPMVMYRRSTAERGWGYKTINTVTRGVKSNELDHILTTLVETMVKFHIAPYHTLHIEHCRNCEGHCMTTRHIPGSYEKRFEDLKKKLSTALPLLTFQQNDNRVVAAGQRRSKNRPRYLKETDPRLGSFEVILRPYCSGYSQLLWSKLAKNEYPVPAEMLKVVSAIIEPKTLVFDKSKPAYLDVVIFNAVDKRPMPSVHVMIYYVSVHPFQGDEEDDGVAMSGNPLGKRSEYISGFSMPLLEEGNEEEEVDDVDETDNDGGDSDDSLDSAEDALASEREFTARSQNSDNASSPRKVIGASDVDSPSRKFKKKKQFQLKSRKSLKRRPLKDIDVAGMSNPAFLKLSAWGKSETLAWLMSHHVSKDCLFFAEMAGVTDGVSLLGLVTESNLVKWGEKNKRTRTAILSDIARMKQSTEQNRDSIGLSNHRLHHMLETSKKLGSTTSLDTVNVDTNEEETSKRTSTSTAATHPSEISHEKERVVLSLVIAGQTNMAGVLHANMEKSGSYLIKVFDSHSVTQWSKLIQCKEEESGTSRIWATALQPRLGKMNVTVSQKVASFCDNFGTHIKPALVIAFTSLRTGKTFFIRVKKVYDSSGYVTHVGTTHLPIGKYFSHVCGSVFEVLPIKTMDKTTFRLKQQSSNTSSLEGLVINYDDSFDEKVCRGHNRVLLAGIRTLQSARHMLRRRRAMKSLNVIGLSIFIRLKFKKIIARVRENLLPRRILRIQKFLRCRMRYRQYQMLKKRVIRFQAIVRGKIFRLAYDKRKAQKILWKFGMIIMRKVKHRRFMKKHNAAVKIQCQWRIKVAHNTMYLQRKLRACTNTSIMTFKFRLIMKVIRIRRRKRLKAEEVAREEAENDLMVAAEQDMVSFCHAHHNHVMMARETERKQLALKLKQFDLQRKAEAIKKHRAVTKMQAWARMVKVRKIGLKHFADIYMAKAELMEPTRRRISMAGKTGYKHMKNIESRIAGKDEWDASEGGEANADPNSPMPGGSPKRKTILGYLGTPLAYMNRKLTTMARDSRSKAAAKRREKTMLGKADNGELQSRIDRLDALQAKLGEDVGMLLEDSEEESSEGDGEYDHFADDEEEELEEEEEEEEKLPLMTRISQSAAVQGIRNSFSKAKDSIKKIGPATKKVYKSTVRIGLKGIRALKQQGSSLKKGSYAALEYGVDSFKAIGKAIADRPKHRAATKIQAAVRGVQARAALFQDESYRKSIKEIMIARMARDPISANSNQEEEYGNEISHQERQKKQAKGKKEKSSTRGKVNVSDDTSTDDKEAVVDVASMRKRREMGIGKGQKGTSSTNAQSAIDRLNALKRLNRYNEKDDDDEEEEEDDDDYSPFKRMDKSESPYSPDIRAKGATMVNKPSFLHSLSVNTNSQKSITLVEEEEDEEEVVSARQMKSKSKENRMVVSSPSNTTNKRPSSPSITAALTNTIKSATPKMLNALSKGARTMADGTLSALGVAGTSMVNAAKAVKSAGDGFLERRLQAQARASRKQNSIVSLTDAMLNVSGCATHLPSIDRAWHIGVFPKGAVSIEGGFVKLQKSLLGGSKDNKGEVEDDKKLVVEYNQLYTGSTVQKHDLQEHSRSQDSRPLSSHTFKDLNFYAHLTDLNRYDEMEVVLFVETLGNRYDGDPSDGNEGSILSQSNSYYAPAFYGTLSIARGASFAPCGGRMHVKLQPNTSVIYKLPKAKSIMSMADLPLIVTLMPAAVPPSSLLRTFRGNHRAAPVWPAQLVEGSLLEPVHSNWDTVSSSVVAIGSFRDKIIVATNSGGAQTGVYCYDSGGINIGNVTNSDLVRLGVINHICGGWNHVACCSTNGTIMIVEYRREDNSHNHQHNATDGRAPLHANSRNVQHEESGSYAWGQPLFVNGGMKQSSITACTMLTHAGLDILFTADKKGHILVAILDNGLCIRHFVNDPQFYPDKIVSLCAISNRLYVARDSGILATFDLTTILDKGKIEEAGSLDGYLLSEDPCYRRDVGFKSMCIVSGNGFLGLKDEDEVASRKRHNKDRIYGGESSIHDTLEGHILLVGGGDEEPTIKVLQPQQRGIRLLVTLQGHSKAVTHLQADAAGRYFFSASKEDKSIIVWDGLCFRREKTFKNISFSSISLGANCLLASHMKPPFLHFYKVFEKTSLSKKEEDREAREVFMKQIIGERILIDPSMQNYVQRMLVEGEQTKIMTARNPSWCFEKLRNVPKGAASNNSDKALVKPSYIEMREEGEIVFRWLNQYFRMEATSSSYHASIVQQPTMMQSMLGGLGVGKSSPRHNSLGGKTTPRRSSTPRAQARQAYERNKLLQSKEGDMSINEDEYDRIFQALSPEKVAMQNAYNEGMRAEMESKSKFSRKIHRLVHHAHFSDSDEDELFREVAYIKPKKKSHANAIRRLNKESMELQNTMEGDTGIPGLISPIRSPKKSDNYHDITMSHHSKFIKDFHYDDGEDSDLDDHLVANTDTGNGSLYDEEGYDDVQLSEEEELLQLRNNFDQLKAQRK